MPKFYFTYGRNPAFPFTDGWTEIEAPDQNTASELFREIHPDRLGSEGVLNCAFVYEEDSFKNTKMYQDSNFGGHCHERLIFDGYRNKRIAFHREVPSPEGEFVIRCAGKKADMNSSATGWHRTLISCVMGLSRGRYMGCWRGSERILSEVCLIG